MLAFADQFAALQRLSLESAQAIVLASFAGFEKLAQLNVQAAKASLEENVHKGMSLLESKDAKAAAETISESAKPAGDKLTAYARQVYEIANETGAEISKVVEKQISEGNRQMAVSLEAMTKSFPAGTEGLATLVKSAVTVANATWDQASKVGRQVAELTEANVVHAASSANGAGNTGRRKTA